jgi:seryl-tRNA synthetase
MLDLAFIREHPEKVKAAMQKLYAEAPIDDILALDVKRRSLLGEVEKLKAQRNAVSKDIGKMNAAHTAGREAKILEMRAVGDQIDALDAQVRRRMPG